MNTLAAPRPVDSACADPAPRFDLYRDIHKALRAVLVETLVVVGRTDAADADETAATLAAVRDLLAMCRAHLDKEQRYVHPAIEARAPGATTRIDDEHEIHLQAIADLEEDVRVVELAVPPARDGALLALYRHLSLFVAENLEHMIVEETAHNAALWAHYDDAELHALEGRIVASLAPPEMAGMLRWMAPSITPGARAQLFGNMRHGMPPDAFAGVLAFAKSTLSAREVDKLDAALSASI